MLHNSFYPRTVPRIRNILHYGYERGSNVIYIHIHTHVHTCMYLSVCVLVTHVTHGVKSKLAE